MDGFGSLLQIQPSLWDAVFWFWDVWLCVNIIEPARCLKHLWDRAMQLKLMWWLWWVTRVMLHSPS